MNLGAKIDLLLRMQVCQMDRAGVYCQNCSYVKRGETCRTALLTDAIKALEEGSAGDTTVEDMVNDVLLDLGLTRTSRGYTMLVYAITYIIDHPESEKRMTYDLFKQAGGVFKCSSQVVGKAMTESIERGFDRCDEDTIARYFGNTIHPDKGRPTNKEFILRIADIVRRNLRNEA